MADETARSRGGDDWALAVSERLDNVVGAVRDKTTVPAVTAARAVVFGIVVGTLGAMAAVLAVIGGVRLLDVYLPLHPLERRVWVVDAAASAIFLGGGAFLWSKRRAKPH
jgi:hypothetical protein